MIRETAPEGMQRFEQVGVPLYLVNPAEAYYHLFFDQRFQIWPGRTITASCHAQELRSPDFMNAPAFQFLPKAYMGGRSGDRNGTQYYPGNDYTSLGEALMQGYLTNSHIDKPLAQQTVIEIEEGGPIVVRPQGFVGGFNTLLAMVSPTDWQRDLALLDAIIAGGFMVIGAEAGLYNPNPQKKRNLAQTGIEVIATPMSATTNTEMLKYLASIDRTASSMDTVSRVAIWRNLMKIALEQQPDLFEPGTGLYQAR